MIKELSYQSSSRTFYFLFFYHNFFFPRINTDICIERKEEDEIDKTEESGKEQSSMSAYRGMFVVSLHHVFVGAAGGWREEELFFFFLNSV